MAWNEMKQRGSDHYKTGNVEPIDLYRAGGMLRDFAIGCIIKYAYRNRTECGPVKFGDMEKIKHYVDILIADTEEK